MSNYRQITYNTNIIKAFMCNFLKKISTNKQQSSNSSTSNSTRHGGTDMYFSIDFESRKCKVM